MPPVPRELRRVLVVEDNVALRAAIARVARGWGAHVLEAGTAAAATALLSPPPDLIIADVRLPDEPAFSVFHAAATLWPKPLAIAISGQASPEEAFRLAQIGVGAYLAKPFSLEELAAAVEGIRREPPALDSFLSAQVGQVPLLVLQEHLRRVMLHQALALSEGNRSGAAKLLDISRQAVQQILRGNARSESGPEQPPAPPEGSAPAKDS